MDNDEKETAKKGIKFILVIWLLIGFFFFQIAALVLMSIISVEKSKIQDRVEEGIDYLPVTITWTSCRPEKTRERYNGKWRTTTRYYNTYSYTVNGTEYYKTVENVAYSVTEGDQETRYYNPNNPSVISGYHTTEEEVEIMNRILIPLHILFQIIAIASLIIFIFILISGKRKVR